MIAAPVQKTVLIPSGLSAAHDDSADGTMRLVRHASREYLLLQREHDLADRERDDQRVQPQHPDEDAVDEPDDDARRRGRRGSPAQAVVGAGADAGDQVAAERDRRRASRGRCRRA